MIGQYSPTPLYWPPQWRIPSPATGRLDLDHVGAMVGEQVAAERSADDVAGLDDAQMRAAIAACSIMPTPLAVTVPSEVRRA